VIECYIIEKFPNCISAIIKKTKQLLILYHYSESKKAKSNAAQLYSYYYDKKYSEERVFSVKVKFFRSELYNYTIESIKKEKKHTYKLSMFSMSENLIPKPSNQSLPF